MSPSLDALLRQVSRSFYLSLRFLPAPVRPGISLAYLLARASDTLADAEGLRAADRAVELDRLLGFWSHGSVVDTGWAALSQGISHAGERLILARFPEILAEAQQLPADELRAVDKALRTIVAGQREDVTRFPDAAALRALPDAESLLHYAYQVAGCVGEFWTQMLALRLPASLLQPPETMRAWGIRYGQGLQLVNILRDLAGDFTLGRCYLPESELQWDHGTPEQASLETCRQRWIAIARDHLADGKRYGESLRGLRVRLTADLPHRLALPTLALVEKSPVMATKVKISRSTVRSSLFRSVIWSLFGPKVWSGEK